MAGTVAGGKSAARTNKEKYGEDFYQKIGAKGGRNGRTGGFFANRELARIAGAKGGSAGARQVGLAGRAARPLTYRAGGISVSGGEALLFAPPGPRRASACTDHAVPGCRMCGS